MIAGEDFEVERFLDSDKIYKLLVVIGFLIKDGRGGRADFVEEVQEFLEGCGWPIENHNFSRLHDKFDVGEPIFLPKLNVWRVITHRRITYRRRLIIYKAIAISDNWLRTNWEKAVEDMKELAYYMIKEHWSVFRKRIGDEDLKFFARMAEERGDRKFVRKLKRELSKRISSSI